MSIDLPTAAGTRRVHQRPQGPQHRLSDLALCALVAFLVYGAASNAIDNLQRAHIASGFGFWNQTAGFDISQTLISYSSQASTYGRAFWVGLLNTLLVAGHRHRVRDHPRLHHRHCAAVEELAAGASWRPATSR